MQLRKMNCIPFDNKQHFLEQNIHQRYFFLTKKLVYIAHNPELHDLTDVVLRLEEDLGSPHVVSLVTDYNVMPVRGKRRGDMRI